MEQRRNFTKFSQRKFQRDRLYLFRIISLRYQLVKDLLLLSLYINFQDFSKTRLYLHRMDYDRNTYVYPKINYSTVISIKSLVLFPSKSFLSTIKTRIPHSRFFFFHLVQKDAWGNVNLKYESTTRLHYSIKIPFISEGPDSESTEFSRTSFAVTQGHATRGAHREECRK